MDPRFKPMLAQTATLEQIKFPCVVSPKVDGFRCIIHEGVAYSRNLKPIPNKYIQAQIGNLNHLYDGHDGELIVGSPTDPDLYRKTSSGVMQVEGEPDFSFLAFDRWDLPALPYCERLLHIQSTCSLPWHEVEDLRDLQQLEQEYLRQGYEGLMVRSPCGPYKYGRSTLSEGYLLKIKRFQDSEAVIIGFEEKQHNANQPVTDLLGYTRRSKHKDQMVFQETLGSLVCSTPEGAVFRIGTGFNDQERQHIWDNKNLFLGKLVKYKSVTHGAKDLPRFPVYLGLRPPEDLDV